MKCLTLFHYNGFECWCEINYSVIPKINSKIKLKEMTTGGDYGVIKTIWNSIYSSNIPNIWRVEGISEKIINETTIYCTNTKGFRICNT
jgi:hypothetical protein